MKISRIQLEDLIRERLQTEKLVGKGNARSLIQNLEDLDRVLGLFDASSLQKFPDIQSELYGLAAEVSDKLKHLRDIARPVREGKVNMRISKKQLLKKIIREELQRECGMAPPPSPALAVTDPRMAHSGGVGSTGDVTAASEELDTIVGVAAKAIIDYLAQKKNTIEIPPTEIPAVGS